MPLTLEQIIWLLNLDLSWEYAAMIQYIQHAAMLTGPEYTYVIQEELQHAQQEHEHAVRLSEKIQYLGGVPTVQVQQILTSLDNVEMLQQDLQAERDALARYLQRIEQLETLHMYDVAQVIREIAVVEQDHTIDLEKALGIQKVR
ncbi:MAG TPA: ferritin-like domain-containing protein [Firmicutes bacterium]|uniref:ferritin-like domain-containing protein n=1 Tax=Gelria sp. Kuro-4 TaxID=2796927 RepID=UPI0019C3C1B5|nr:ferritin-like domain-containing protein [Gelria sp. Kuro-4]BCV24427.1 ferritin [Gelria sp. Kuro-4]HHV57197.1 ferritin-like domain-containing protein [Bacillota bacterium]